MLPRPDNPTQPDLPAPEFIQPPHRAESFDTDKQKGEGGEWGQSVGAAVMAVARTNDLQDEEEPPPPPPSPPPPPPPLAATVLAGPGTARPAVSTKPPAPPGRRRRPLTPAALSSHASHDAAGCQSRRHLFDQPRPSKAADAGVVRDRSGGADEGSRPTHREIWSWQPLSLRCACGVACARRHQRAARRARQPISLSTHVACAKKHRCAGSLDAHAPQRWRKRRERIRQSQWSEAGTRRHLAASSSALWAQAMTPPYAVEVQTHNGPTAQRLARIGRSC